MPEEEGGGKLPLQIRGKGGYSAANRGRKRGRTEKERKTWKYKVKKNGVRAALREDPE